MFCLRITLQTGVMFLVVTHVIAESVQHIAAVQIPSIDQ